MAPSKLQEFISTLRNTFERQAMMGAAPVLLTSPAIQPYVRSIVERFRPMTVVMSQNEVHPKARIKTLITYFIVWLPAWVVLGLWIGFQFLAISVGGGGVAWWAHVGGFFAGVILIVPMRQKGVPLFDRGRKKFEFKLAFEKAPKRASRSAIPDSGKSGGKRFGRRRGPWGE